MSKTPCPVILCDIKFFSFTSQNIMLTSIYIHVYKVINCGYEYRETKNIDHKYCDFKILFYLYKYNKNAYNSH